MLPGRSICGLWKICSIQILICLLWILTNMNVAQLSSNFKKKFQRTLYCLWLKTLRDNYDLLYIFVSYSTLPWKLRAPFLLDSTTKNSDWSSALRQSHLRTLKKALFNFQFVYYGYWQIWKPLSKVQTSKIKKIKSSVLFIAFGWKHCVTNMICCTILFPIQLFPEN